MATEYGSMLERGEAAERVRDLGRQARTSLAVETVALDAVAGRILAEDIVAERALPARDTATMDGFAFDATDGYPLSVVSTDVFPESTAREMDEGHAVPIATGGPLPHRANAVLKREDATVDDGKLTGSDIQPGENVYERGTNVTAGETLFEAGERLSPKDSILLVDLGLDGVPVRDPFSVGVLATGTEIHEDSAQDLDSHMLAGLISSWGHQTSLEGSVPDEYERVRDRIESLASDHDVVVTSGGTSVGKKDYVLRALSDLGEVLFQSVRMRPGKPIVVARLPDAVAFAIPGKPVAAHTVTAVVARPFFTGQSELPTVEATMGAAVDVGDREFEYAIPIVLEDGEAMPLGHADSTLSVYDDTFNPSVLSSSTRATRADGLVLTEAPLTAGETVAVIPYTVVE